MSLASLRRATGGPNLARESELPEFIPYTRHVDPWTIGTKDGYLLQVIRFEGLPFETMDQAALNHLEQVRNTLLVGLASSRFGLYSHIIRRRVSQLPRGTFYGFAKLFDDGWHRKLEEKQLFVNDHYLTIVRRSLGGGVGVGEGALRWLSNRADREGAAARRKAELRALHEATHQIRGALAPYGARGLGLYEIGRDPRSDRLPKSELLEFLGYLVNQEHRPLTLPRVPLDEHLAWKRPFFGSETLELRGSTQEDTTLGAMLGIREYSAGSAPGMLDGLLRLPFEMVVSQSFGFVERQAALERVKREERILRATDDDALSQRDQLGEALDDLASNRVAFGEHHLTCLVKGRTQEELRDALSATNAELIRLGIIAVRSDLDLKASYFAQLPGNFAYIPRRALISTQNFAGYSSFHNFPRGRATGNHWGPCWMVLETTSGTPYAFNTHVDDLGNFTVVGPSGNGKTVLINSLIAQAERYRPFTILLDKDRGSEIFVRALGGQYSVIQPGHPTGFNPLQLEDTPVHRAFLRDWLGQLVKPSNGESLSAQDQGIIANAVVANYTRPESERRLRFLRELFEGHERHDENSLAARLAPWWGSGARAWLFDNPMDELELDPEVRRTVGFDLTYILDDAIGRSPAVMYMLHRIDQALDGRKAIVMIDEGWKALDDSTFRYLIRDLFKTIRKRNGVLGFATQSASDMVQSPIADAILEQSPTHIFLPNYKADETTYCDGFGLTLQELRTIRELPKESHCFLVKHGAHSVIARLDLSGEEDLLAVLSGRTATVNLLDQIRSEAGDDPATWMPIFQERRHEV